MADGGERTVVIDAGSYKMRCGFAGDKTPFRSFSPILARPPNSKAVLVGDAAVELHHAVPDTRLTHVIDSFDGVTNWDGMSSLLHHAFYKQLSIAPEEHKILMTEQPHNPKLSRERITSMAFEEYNTPAFYLAIGPVLAAYAAGRTTAMVVDCGYTCTQQVCVYEGYSIPNVTHKITCGGANVSNKLMELLNQYRGARLTNKHVSIVDDIKHKHAEVAYQSVTEDQPTSISFATKRLFPNPMMISNLTRWTSELADTTYFGALPSDLRREVLQFNFTESRDVTISRPVEEAEYMLPDGRTILIGGEMWRCARMFSSWSATFNLCTEVLMHPHLDPAMPTLCAAVYDACEKSGFVECRDMYDNILLSGGGSCFAGLADRLKAGVRKRLGKSTYRVRVIECLNVPNVISCKPPNREHCGWLGGSILASLSTFSQMWLSKAEYDECGPSLVHRKCF